MCVFFSTKLFPPILAEQKTTRMCTLLICHDVSHDAVSLFVSEMVWETCRADPKLLGALRKTVSPGGGGGCSSGYE